MEQSARVRVGFAEDKAESICSEAFIIPTAARLQSQHATAMQHTLYEHCATCSIASAGSI